MKAFAGTLLKLPAAVLGLAWFVCTCATATLAPVTITGPLGLEVYNSWMGSQPILLDPRNPLVAPQNATCAEFTAQVDNNYAQPYLLYVEYSVILYSEGGQLTVSSATGQIHNTSFTTVSGCFACAAAGSGSVGRARATVRMASVYPAAKVDHLPQVWNLLFVCDGGSNSTTNARRPSAAVPRNDNASGKEEGSPLPVATKGKQGPDAVVLPLQITGPGGLRLYDNRYGVDPSLSDPGTALVLPATAECATLQFGLATTDFSQQVAADWQYSVAYSTVPPRVGSFDLSIPSRGCLRTLPVRSGGDLAGAGLILGACDYLRSADLPRGYATGLQASSFASACFRCLGAQSTVLLNVTLSVDGSQATGGDLGVRQALGVDASFYVRIACGASLERVKRTAEQAAHSGAGVVTKAKEEVKEGVGAVVKGAEAAKSIWDRIRHRHH